MSSRATQSYLRLVHRCLIACVVFWRGKAMDSPLDRTMEMCSTSIDYDVTMTKISNALLLQQCFAPRLQNLCKTVLTKDCTCWGRYFMALGQAASLQQLSRLPMQIAGVGEYRKQKSIWIGPYSLNGMLYEPRKQDYSGRYIILKFVPNAEMRVCEMSLVG